MKSIMEMSEKELQAFRIDNGISIDKYSRSVYSKWGGIFERMKKGDSVLLGTKEEAKHLYLAMHRSKIKSSRRKVENGYRVWRMD